MTTPQIFERYIEYKLQRAGALTPGQKIEVVKGLLEEARWGVVPVGETSVARLPLDEPGVQAVIRGEPISIGNTVVKRKSGLQALSDPQKFAILGAALVVPVLLSVLIYLLMSSPRAQAVPESTATLAPSATPYPTETLTPVPTLTATPLPTETPSATPIPALLMGVGSPAEEANAPASLELGGRLFVLQKGKVEPKTGVWSPQGPEWLSGTEVRRVIALPLAQLADLLVQPGDQVTLRTRNGRVVVYPITQVLRLTPNQIEAFMSLSPSIIIPLFDPLQDPSSAERLAIIGELTSPPAPTATPLIQRAFTIEDINLRARPALSGDVLAGLPRGTWLDVPTPLQTRQADGLAWVYVRSSLGSGWVARIYLSFNP